MLRAIALALLTACGLLAQYYPPLNAQSGAAGTCATLAGDVTGTCAANTVAKVGGKSVSLSGALTTSGAFAQTLTFTGSTNVTFPTSGTLSTTTGTVTTVGFTGGLLSVANPTTTPAITVAGTSGGIPYFSSTSTWATSALLLANGVVLGGGAGTTPSTTAGLTYDGTSLNDPGQLTIGATDLILSRKGAASLQFGTADAASAVAQTIGPQSVVTGTSNVAGANFTIRASQGTGTGASGSVIIQTAAAGTTGSTPNALVTSVSFQNGGTGQVMTLGSANASTFVGVASNRSTFGYDGASAYMSGTSGKALVLFSNGAGLPSVALASGSASVGIGGSISNNSTLAGAQVLFDGATGNMSFNTSKGQHFNAQAAASDMTGTVTITNPATTGALSFNVAYTNAPSCIITPTTNQLLTVISYWVTTSTTAVTANVQTTPTSALTFNYVCHGNPN